MPIEWVSPAQAAFHASVLEFARTLPSEGIRDDDQAARFPRAVWDRCGAFGLMGLPAPESDGGAGMDVVATMLGLEALGEGCEDAGLVFSINAHLWTSVVPLWRFGTDAQRARWLPGLCAGTLVGCHAITEPEAGSDPYALRATARRTDEGWVLNGTKTFITNAPEADVTVVFARSDPEATGAFGVTAFVIEKGTPGCTAGPPLDKMGLRTSPMSEVILEDCVVGEDAVLGKVGRGAQVFQESMRWERACIMASQVGAMRRTMQRCIAYAQTREQFGEPIGKFEAIADKIAEMKIAVDAGRALVLRVGWLMDQGEDATVEASVAKAFVSEANVRVHRDALQIHGGYGYMKDYEIERGLRDALGSTIYSGTTEIQRRIIAKGLGL